MYKVNSYVMYKRDICKIKSIKEKYMNNNDYYQISPLKDQSLIINVPTTSPSIRPIIDKKICYNYKGDIMQLKDLNKEYDRLQLIYGDPSLHSIYNGGCTENPDICFVFMNPTGRNIASLPNWNGPYYPWLGTKQVWDLFLEVNLIDEKIYQKIKSIKGKDWTPEFCEEVYESIKRNKIFITNLGKCTQIDARPLTDSYFTDYLPLLEKEISIIKPKVIILFGNQVSSNFLNKKISVSQVRKQFFEKVIDATTYKCFPVFYPVGNGRFNINKSIEDINWIKENYVKE